MKTLILTLVFFLLTAPGSLTVAAQDDDPYSNENAPANYDANLKAGGKAVGVMGSSLETVKIISKTGGVYKATLDDGTDNEYLFRANAVYPYFDIQAFGKIKYGNEDLIAPYLECYAKKRGLDFEKLKGDAFRLPYSVNVKAMKEELQNGQAQLAQIETQLKNLAARPDTFLPYQENPAVWADIAANRAEYLPCALGDRQTDDIKNSPWLMSYRDDIAKTLKAVNDYEPATKTSMGSGSDVALYAVSQNARSEWLKGANALAFKDEIDKLLAPLADALAKKLPTYLPDMSEYPVHNAAEEAMLKRVLTNPARYKIFKSGLMQSAWQIDKNVLGIPNARYKNGLIYLRDTNADHPYCYETYVNIIQDYAGGGTYAASRASFIRDILVGCPAGVK